MNDLELLTDPEPRRVPIRGEVLDILPLRMKQLSAFSKAVDPCLQAIIAGQWKAALDDNSDALAKAVGIATGRGDVWAMGLYPDEFLVVCEAVLEVNLDFFARLVMPKATGLGTKLGLLLAGATSSPDLSKADTGPRPS